MSSKPDGGPAFPMPPTGTGDPRDGMTSGHPGMTLRDWFAGQFAPSVLEMFASGKVVDYGGRKEMSHTDVCDTAVVLADTLLQSLQSPSGIVGIQNDALARQEQYLRDLRAEVNCRIEHGADSGGHLEFVQAKLDAMLKARDA